MKTNDQLAPNIFVIFGGAGDLTWRKLMPALFDLSQSRSIPAHFAIIAVDRVELSEDALRKRLHEGVKQVRPQRESRRPRSGMSSAQHIRYLAGRFQEQRDLQGTWRPVRRAWKRSGAPKPNASSTWPRRPRCSAKFPTFLDHAGLARRPGTGADRHRETDRV